MLIVSAQNSLKELGRCDCGDRDVLSRRERPCAALDVDQDRRVEDRPHGSFGMAGRDRRMRAMSRANLGSGCGPSWKRRSTSAHVARVGVTPRAGVTAAMGLPCRSTRNSSLRCSTASRISEKLRDASVAVIRFATRPSISDNLISAVSCHRRPRERASTLPRPASSADHMPLASPMTLPSGSANIATVTGPVCVGLSTVFAPRPSAFFRVPSRSVTST